MKFFRSSKHPKKPEDVDHAVRRDLDTDPCSLERQASDSFSEKRFEEAFGLFRKAADIYRATRNHKQSALCFVSAASCWSLKSEEKTFYNAAIAYEEAAKEAERSGDPEYASLLYKYASINYERDGEFSRFSDCSYMSKESLRIFLTYSFFSSGKIKPITISNYEGGFSGDVKKFFHLLMLTFSWAIWGHGERPVRSFIAVVFVVLFSAVLYRTGTLVSGNEPFCPDMLDSLYFSVVTFSTVGYGDIVPVGMTKAVAMLEVFSGIFLMPVFVIALTRKYLRI